MAWEQIILLMETCTKAITLWGSQMATENTNGRMEPTTSENSKMERSKGREDGGNLIHLKLPLSMENMKEIKNTVMAFISGRVAIFIRAIMRMTRDMVMER